MKITVWLATHGVVQCTTYPTVYVLLQHMTGRTRAETLTCSSDSKVMASSKTPPSITQRLAVS